MDMTEGDDAHRSRDLGSDGSARPGNDVTRDQEAQPSGGSGGRGRRLLRPL